MSHLVKHDDRAPPRAVGAFGGQPVRPRPAPTTGASAAGPDPVALEQAAARQREALEHEIEALRGQIAAIEEAGTRNAAESYESGREAGLAEAVEGSERRIALLEAGLDDARKDFAAKTADVEALALSIARAVLAKILGDDAVSPEVVRAAIGRRMRDLDAAEVRKVRVSASDFADAVSLADLAERYPDLALVRDRGLEAGRCRIDLDLGCVDASPGSQWARADAHLAALAGDAETAA